jgi:hypothetical protein
LALLHGRDDFLDTDGGGAENSPAEFVGHADNDKGREGLSLTFSIPRLLLPDPLSPICGERQPNTENVPQCQSCQE